MMIECEVKIGQTVESIEHTRREGNQFVVIKRWRKRGMKESEMEKGK